MKKGKTTPPGGDDLRHRAEEKLSERQPPGGVQRSEADVRKLLHELEVHQIELEMQNEELQAARRQTEAGLERYTALFDFAPIGYATLAADGTIREINHAAARLLGNDRSRLIGRRFGLLVLSSHLAAFNALLDRALKSEVSESGEVSLPGNGETPQQLRLWATVLAGPEHLILLAFEDVSERNLEAERMVRTERALRDAERRKDEFLAVLSHELRNPMAAIRNSLFVLARAKPGGEQAGRAQAIIDRQVTHLSRLLDDLLDVTRITRGKVRLQRERLELGVLARHAMDDQRINFEKSGIQLEGDFEPGPYWIDADAARMTQVLINLLVNAEKFTPRGGRVVVTLRRESGRAVLRVRDTGAGVAPDVLQHLFEPFAQAPQTMDRARGGLGLGLAMVKGLVELHGGTVGITSEGLGRGTELMISLPLGAAPASAAAGEDSTPAPRRRVLVIEDNKDAADSLREALSLGGHEVQVAYDGASGLELARTFRPEILICDLGLPGMDGYEVAKAFRADPALKDTYLVALSGYALPEDVQRATAAGFDRHVGKPPNLDALDRLLADAPAEPELRVLH